MRCTTQVVAPILALKAGKALREAANGKAAEGCFEVRAASVTVRPAAWMHSKRIVSPGWDQSFSSF